MRQRTAEKHRRMRQRTAEKHRSLLASALGLAAIDDRELFLFGVVEAILRARSLASDAEPHGVRWPRDGPKANVRLGGIIALFVPEFDRHQAMFGIVGSPYLVLAGDVHDRSS